MCHAAEQRKEQHLEALVQIFKVVAIVVLFVAINADVDAADVQRKAEQKNQQYDQETNKIVQNFDYDHTLYGERKRVSLWFLLLGV